jgi:hypothetical protein
MPAASETLSVEVLALFCGHECEHGRLDFVIFVIEIASLTIKQGGT